MLRSGECGLATIVAVLTVSMLFTPTVEAQLRSKPTPNDSLKSTEVADDRKVTFRIYAPKADDVRVFGDFGQGGLMTRNDQGVWSIEVGPLRPDYYNYTFVIDGVRTVDPKNAMIKQGISQVESVFLVPGNETEFQATRDVPHGDVRAVWYQSNTLHVQRRMHVYTPPGYDSGSESYPVFYLLHGGGDEDSGWSTVGRAGFIIDNLIAAKKAVPMIVVMPNASLSRPKDFPSRVRAGDTPSQEYNVALEDLHDTFTDELLKEILPNIESTYRVKKGRENLALAGLSMGGRQALRVLTSHPDLFGYVAIWSGGPFEAYAAEWERGNESFLDELASVNDTLKHFEVVVGTEDHALRGSKFLGEVLKKRGIEHEFRITDGGHTWINWRQNLHGLAPRLFRSVDSSNVGSPSSVSPRTKYTEVKDSLPVRGTEYMIRVPQNWNGTLLNDLDYCKKANSKMSMMLLEKGYALSGTTRRPDRSKNYDPAHEAHDFVSIFDIFEVTFGKPKRIIQLGCSGGGTVSLSMAEKYSDRIDGAIAACAATSQWMANTHLDGLFVMQALLAPDLPIVDLGGLDEQAITELGNKWKDAIDKAQQTPAGRAHIALAITIGQWPAWGGRGEAPVPKPDPTDVPALQESMYYSMAMLLPNSRTKGTTMLERAGRGQLRSNTDVDYAALYKNGNTLYKAAVETLYKEAGQSLEADLKRINAAPRIKADPAAVKYWSSPGRTHVGQPKVPLLRIHVIGDGLVYPTMTQGYEELVREKGHSMLFRSAYVDRWGHCSFSLVEWLAAIETMNQRLDTGVWPSTDPAALNKLADSLDPTGTARFSKFEGVEKYNRTWFPAATDYIRESTTKP